jgi:CBS domain-containing protein
MEHLSWEQIQERIQKAEAYEHLRAIRDQVHEMFDGPLLFADFLSHHLELNRTHDSLIRKTIELAERQLSLQGVESPGVPYAFLLYGSGGRCEQTLWSDQDNGLIYADSENEEEAKEAAAYFRRLSQEILHGFRILGYPPCTGNVLAGNPMWRKPLKAYLDMMYSWLENPEWENVRYLLIMSDARCIFGDEKLVQHLKHSFIDYVKQHRSLLKAMLRNTLHHKVSLGVFGQLITERYGEDAGGIDIKYGAYIPVVNGIRLLSIQAGIMETSTLGRILELLERNAIEPQQAEEWTKVTEFALKLRAMTPFQLEEGLYATRGKMPANRLTKELRQELKFCLRTGRRLQKYVSRAVEEIVKG